MAAKNVTVTVLPGSGGFSIARLAAERLGFRYYDWEITSQAAEEAGVSPEAVANAERVPSFVNRILDRFFSSGFYSSDIPEAVGPSSITLDGALQTMTSENYRTLIERVVVDLANRGDSLIVGHAAQVFLRDRHDTLRVLIHAPPANRAVRLAVEEGISADEAKARIERSDRERSHFFKHYYHVNQYDAALYDLTINTDAIPDEAALELMVKASKSLLKA